MSDETKQTTGVRTVDALSEDEFQLLVAKMLGDMKVLRGCGNSVMSLVMVVARAVVRLAYDTKVVVVREETK
jgi:hypothetical protein